MHPSRDVSLVVLLQAIEFTIAALSAFTSDLRKSMSCIFALTNLATLLPGALRACAADGLISPALKPRAVVACDAGEDAAKQISWMARSHAFCWSSQLWFFSLASKAFWGVARHLTS